MKELDNLAENVKNQLQLDYDTASVKFIEAFIERQRPNFDSEQRKGLVNSIGAFIGACIIKNYGGHWQVDEDSKAVCIAFDDNNKIFPFAKTAKQFENGLEDSVYSFFIIIPTVFKSSMQANPGYSNTAQTGNTIKPTKKWWKFW